eukprot:2466197-Rhodomonas_salina.2
MVFYALLFRQTVRSTLAQVYATRAFVARMPCHVLDKQESDVIRLFFESSSSALRLTSSSRCFSACFSHNVGATDNTEAAASSELHIDT